MFSMNYQNSLNLAFSMAAENHAEQQAIVTDVEEYGLYMKEQFLAQRARQPGEPVQPGAYIGAPSTSRQADSAATDKASEAATAEKTISSSANENGEEGGGHGVEEV
jgi:hypothetical protein